MSSTYDSNESLLIHIECLVQYKCYVNSCYAVNGTNRMACSVHVTSTFFVVVTTVFWDSV